MKVLELSETGVELGAKIVMMRAMSQFSSNPMTNCLTKVNPNGSDEAIGMRLA